MSGGNGDGDGNGNGKVTVCEPDPQLSNWPLPPDSDIPHDLRMWLLIKVYYEIEKDRWDHKLKSVKMDLKNGSWWNRIAPTHR